MRIRGGLHTGAQVRATMAISMIRRHLIAALSCWPAGRLLAQDEAPRPRHKISAGELYKALSARFPVRLGLTGLFELQVNASRLLLLPARQQLGAALLAQVSGLQAQRAPAGEVDIAFALRYERADQSVRAHRPEVLGVRWPGLAPDAQQLLQGLLPAMAQNVGEVVLHKLTPRELALADTMGFEPETVEVVEDGLVIVFGPKPRS